MAFKDIAGNVRIKRILKLAFERGRVPNSVIFAGPEGVGRREMALTLAKTLNCLTLTADSCDECPSCRAIDAGGYSLGGGVAAEIARVDPRCRAVVSLDSLFQNANMVLSVGVDKPCLFFNNETTSFLSVYNKLQRDGVYLQIRSTTHESFWDYYWTSGSQADVREANRTIDGYSLWFLNKYLKGVNEPLPTTQAYPRAFNLKQK